MALINQGGKLLLQNGVLVSGAACCCGGQCSGPCDSENPCPTGCVCVDGQCVTGGACCDADGNCLTDVDGVPLDQATCEACYFCTKQISYQNEIAECPVGYVKVGCCTCVRGYAVANCDECDTPPYEVDGVEYSEACVGRELNGWPPCGTWHPGNTCDPNPCDGGCCDMTASESQPSVTLSGDCLCPDGGTIAGEYAFEGAALDGVTGMWWGWGGISTCDVGPTLSYPLIDVNCFGGDDWYVSVQFYATDGDWIGASFGDVLTCDLSVDASGAITGTVAVELRQITVAGLGAVVCTVTLTFG